MRKTSKKMKLKILILIMIAFLFCNCNQTKKNDLTVEQIWNSYLEQYGNQKEIDKVTSIVQVSRSKLVKLNRVGTIESTLKNGKIRLHYIDEQLDVTTVYDGSNFVRYCNGEKQEVLKMEEIVIKQYADFFHERNYLKHGYNIKLVGNDMIKNKPVYIVEYYSKDCSSLYYIDKKDFSIMRIKNKEQDLWPIEIKSKDGIKYISKMISIDEYDTNEIDVISIDFNKEINDSFFQLNEAPSTQGKNPLIFKK